MREKIEERLQALRTEFKHGQEMLADLETRRTETEAMLLRISGAVQVLEELLNGSRAAQPPDADASLAAAGAGNGRERASGDVVR